MEYTQEQIDKMLLDAGTAASKGLFTQKEMDTEADRRVESGIQKGLGTAKDKWLEDFKKEQNLTADELAATKLKEKMDDLNGRESELSKRSNLLDAKDKLTEAKVPAKAYGEFINSMVVADAEMTTANVQNFINMYAGTLADIEVKVKAELSHVTPPPNDQNNDGPMTADKFKALGYAEKVAFKASNRAEYDKFMK